MKHNTTRPQTAERYTEIQQIERELKVNLENLFELPQAEHIYHNQAYLIAVTTNELLIYSIPNLETVKNLTHYDAKKVNIMRRKKWMPWFIEQLSLWASEKGLTLND